MPRKPLPLGTHGNIRLYGYRDGRWVAKSELPAGIRLPRWRAITNYRGYDGVTKPVERTGTSVTDASNRLREDLNALSQTRAKLTTSSRVRDAVPAYQERIREECAPTTCDRYESILKNHVLPGLGGLLITECTVTRLQKFDAGLVSNRTKNGKAPKKKPKLAPGTRRIVREVVRGLLQFGVEDDVLTHNPVGSTRKITGGTIHAAKSIPIEQVPTLFTKLDNDAYSCRADLPDLVRTLFGTGCRLGEALALTWEYVNLGDKPIERTAFGKTRTIPPRSLWINGTISEPKGKGGVRSPVKTKRSNRVVGIPDFLYLVLTMRKTAEVSETEPVFPNGGTKSLWRRPKALSKSIMLMRKRLGIPEFLSHSGRKTAATALYQAQHDARDVADQFGHSDSDFTRTHYVDPGLANPETARTLDRAYSKSA